MFNLLRNITPYVAGTSELLKQNNLKNICKRNIFVKMKCKLNEIHIILLNISKSYRFFLS